MILFESFIQERLYDPDFRKNRSVPTEPEPIYVREFKSRPPKQLEHVVSFVDLLKIIL